MEDIHDIRGPIEILTLWQEYLPYLLVLAGLLAIFFFIYYYKRIKSRKPIRTAPNLSSYEIAINQLNEAKDFIQPGMDKPLAIALSDLIRIYIESTFSLPATEETTDEFLANIHNSSTFSGDSLTTLTKFLEKCDLAKFAKIQFNGADQQSLHTKAQTFLQSANELHIKLATPTPSTKSKMA